MKKVLILVGCLMFENAVATAELASGGWLVLGSLEELSKLEACCAFAPHRLEELSTDDLLEIVVNLLSDGSEGAQLPKCRQNWIESSRASWPLPSPVVRTGLQGIEEDARQGLADAQVEIGKYLFFGTLGELLPQDQPRGVSYFEAAAEQDNADGQFYYGCCLAIGCCIGQDLQAAVGFFEKAAQQGHPYAQALSGMCLAKGIHCAADLPLGRDYLNKAKEQSLHLLQKL